MTTKPRKHKSNDPALCPCAECREIAAYYASLDLADEREAQAMRDAKAQAEGKGR